MKSKSVCIKGIISIFVGIIIYFLVNTLILNLYSNGDVISLQDSNFVGLISSASGILVALITFLVLRINFIKKNDKKIIYEMAYIDKATGVRNKNKFILDASVILSKTKTSYAIVVLELNNFEVINELYGYNEGNNLLKYVANVIKDILNPEDEIFARSSAGRFNLLVKFDDVNGIRTKLEMIMDEISEYKRTKSDHSKCSVNSCCGIYVINDEDISNIPSDMEFNISHLVSRAKFALSEIAGKYINYCSFYNEEIKSQLIYENDMEYALANDEFIVYIQPKYDIQQHVLTGGEALVRWNHHSKGFLSPDKFVPLFEKNGFIVDLDMFVFETVCKMQRKWIDMGLNPVRISVNQSRIHLFTRDYVETLKKILDKYSVPPELIELEITESVAFENFNGRLWFWLFFS